MILGGRLELRCPAATPGTEGDHLSVDVNLPLSLAHMGSIIERLGACFCVASMEIKPAERTKEEQK